MLVRLALFATLIGGSLSLIVLIRYVAQPIVSMRREWERFARQQALIGRVLIGMLRARHDPLSQEWLNELQETFPPRKRVG